MSFELATFAAGCFWGVQEHFRNLAGVQSTTVGYTGGSLIEPSYEQVCTGRTGHAEVVRVEFDPAIISYERLLSEFFRCHDATQLNRQGVDVGTQYRSAIFYHNASQERAAELATAGVPGAVTEITAATEFYPAEEYHQQYFAKRGGGACQLV